MIAEKSEEKKHEPSSDFGDDDFDDLDDLLPSNDKGGAAAKKAGTGSMFSEDSQKEKQDIQNVDKKLEELKKADNLNIEVERTGQAAGSGDISDNYDDGFEDDEEIPESLPSDNE